MKFLIYQFWLILPLLTWSGAQLSAQATDAPQEEKTNTIFDYFYTLPADLPKLSIATDMRRLVNQKYKEEYQPAVLSYSAADGSAIEMDFRIRARGNQRKKVCFYPPLRFKFNKSRLQADGLLPINDLKVANQCKNNETGREYLIKEYVAYRLYNLLTPYSFRVRLVQLDYYDSKRDKSDVEMLALILEPTEELATRLRGVEVKQNSTRIVHLEREAYDQLCLFQYMIGNTDWNVTNMHNLLTVKTEEYPRLVAVTYDFDYSGIVETDYALPHTDLPIERVTQRYHIGASLDPENLERLAAKFLELEPAFRQTCRDIAPLDKQVARETEDFISPFFELLKDKDRLVEIFVEKKQ